MRTIENRFFSVSATYGSKKNIFSNLDLIFLYSIVLCYRIYSQTSITLRRSFKPSIGRYSVMSHILKGARVRFGPLPTLPSSFLLRYDPDSFWETVPMYYYK